MRKYVKRGGIKQLQYKELREKVHLEFLKLDSDLISMHDFDLQEIALQVAEDLGLHTFKVVQIFNLFDPFNIFLFRQATVGATILSKNTTSEIGTWINL